MEERYLSEEKKQEIKNCRTFSELLDVKYGPAGTPERDQFEEEAEAFLLAERLKEERLKAGLTQEQLAERIGTKKSYISRIENGKCDVRLPTLYKIFRGLGKQISITVL
ncbi:MULTISPECIES: helix-turn-helix transcriptional regulator [Parabacteroides]|jgi:HTH-type transcriptional regulator / antitoxin HipB|uniref:Helix-turn-helix transcriptional regulator n=1 Tax=Parabacteroides segnis TaxID=2763058 RepID=A0ABR7E9A6_9BACT|nr:MULTISPECIES: helix-turn-helix transcriptional regulator [Parabacteroides]MBC5646347.1 helix-turn-helix transcriptional regulator [Parabacteroides segnis]MCM0715783.1 helix-turn-helix domain-containing protein [Parabacteroides sp. TA-V-105]